MLLSAPGESPSVIGVVVLFSFWRHSSPFLTFCEACYPKVSSLARTKARWRHGGDFVLCLAGHLFTTNLGGIARTLDLDLRYSAFNFDSTTLCSSIQKRCTQFVFSSILFVMRTEIGRGVSQLRCSKILSSYPFYVFRYMT